ncbi:MAG: DUF6496 domain-containing protein [Ferruginibacter sp.]
MAKYSKAAQKSVKAAVKKIEKGTLRSGEPGKKVTDKKQAVAIGLSEAKKKGAKVPTKPSAAKNSVVKKAGVSKKASPKKTSLKKTPSKKALPVKKNLKKTPSSAKKDTVVGKAQKQPSLPKKVSTKSNNIIDGDPDVIEGTQDKGPGPQPSSVERPGINDNKKVYNKASSRIDANHNMSISSIAKGGRKPSGKKPLW